MNLRRFMGVVSSIASLSFTSNIILSPLNIDCGNKKVTIPPYYISGRGSELRECVENRKKTDYPILRSILGVRDTTFPELKYGDLPEGTVGIYVIGTNLITFDTNRVAYIDGKVRCGLQAIHEFTHYLLNKKSLEIGNGIWPNFSTMERKDYTLNDYGMEYVSEGLARYLGEGERSKYLGPEWPETEEQLYCANSYVLGNQLVTRILDEFGSEAIPFMIRDPPRGSEIFNPKKWQNRIRSRILSYRRNNVWH